VDHLLWIEATAGQFFGRKFNDDLLFGDAEQFDFADVGHLQQAGAQGVDIITQFALTEAVGDKTINSAEGVIKFVVDRRRGDTCRQRGAHVLHFFPHLIPQIGHLFRWCVVTQSDKNHRFARFGVAFDKIQIGNFL